MGQERDEGEKLCETKCRKNNGGRERETETENDRKAPSDTKK